MKKLLIFRFFLILLLVAIFTPFGAKPNAATQVDQSYKPYPAYGTYDVTANDPIAQYFTPAKDSLTSLEVVITTSASSDKDFTVTIKRGGTTVGVSSATQSLTPGTKTILFGFSPAVGLTPGVKHTIYLDTTDNTAAWLYGQSGDKGTYSGGYAIINGVEQADIDLHFATYGPEAATEENKDEEKTSNEKIDESIGIPENLEVLDKGADFVELTWDSLDDANISGYKIYYGTTPQKLKETIDVGDDTSYLIRGLEDNTLYYFAISAYNADRDEGEKSPVIQVRTSKPKQVVDALDVWWYIARIASVLILILAAILGYRWFKKRKKGEKKPVPQSSKSGVGNSTLDEEIIPVKKEHDLLEKGKKE